MATEVMAWTSPQVLILFALGFVSLIAFVVIEQRVARPMLDLRLFRIRPFAYGNHREPRCRRSRAAGCSSC